MLLVYISVRPVIDGVAYIEYDISLTFAYLREAEAHRKEEYNAAVTIYLTHKG